MIDLQPKKCNLCGGPVEHISNAEIYGRTYGSGYCYRCRNCDAYVGTHKNRPKIALGILADAEMRKMKMKCHDIFDNLWQIKVGNERQHYRQKCYDALANKLNIDKSACHFGYFDMAMLKQAYEILISGKLQIILKPDCFRQKEGRYIKSEQNS